MDITELNQRRKDIDMSFDELAKLSNLSKSTVEKVLFGVVKHPRIDTMQAIAHALGLNSNSKSPWTAADEAQGVTDSGMVRVNAMQYELLELFDLIGQQGEARQQEFLKIARVYANMNK